MWLTRADEYEHVEKIRTGSMDTIVKFDDDGHARTTKENGEVLIERGIATERDTGHESPGDGEDEQPQSESSAADSESAEDGSAEDNWTSQDAFSVADSEATEPTETE